MAGRRKFNYQTLLRVRKRQEEQEAHKLAQIQNGIRAARKQRDEITALQRELLDTVGQATKERFGAGVIQPYYQYERHVAQRHLDADSRLNKLRADEAAQRGELETAMKRRKAVEKLKQRRDEQAYAEWLKDEQQRADELALSRAARASMERREGRGGSGE